MAQPIFDVTTATREEMLVFCEEQMGVRPPSNILDETLRNKVTSYLAASGAAPDQEINDTPQPVQAQAPAPVSSENPAAESASSEFEEEMLIQRGVTPDDIADPTDPTTVKTKPLTVAVDQAVNKSIEHRAKRFQNQKFRRFQVVINKEKGGIDPVPLGVNGRINAVKRGVPVILTEPYLTVLKNAVKTVYDPETMERSEELAYPFQVLGEVV